MTGFRWVHFMKAIIDILKNANCGFSYNYYTKKITTIGGEDITPHLFAVFESIDQIKDEYWREKISNAYGIPVGLLFPAEGLLPAKEKIGKYNFVHDKKPRVYISGRITGLSEKVYKNNFNSAELYLTSLGYDVVNPVAYDTIQNGTWEDYMRRDIKLLCDCDYIYLLEGWEASDGASLEKLIADNLKIETLVIKEKPNPVDENGMVV